jgi:hypothetical protein
MHPLGRPSLLDRRKRSRQSRGWLIPWFAWPQTLCFLQHRPGRNAPILIGEHSFEISHSRHINLHNADGEEISMLYMLSASISKMAW